MLGEKAERAEPGAMATEGPNAVETDEPLVPEVVVVADSGASKIIEEAGPVAAAKPPVAQWNPRTIVECFPGLAMYVEHPVTTWRAIDAGASRMAGDMGINARSWHQAGLDMGTEQRCVAIGLVAELLASGRITTTAGQYFGGILKRARRGELHLDRSVWGLRHARNNNTSRTSH